jgi:hypothetical protein
MVIIIYKINLEGKMSDLEELMTKDGLICFMVRISLRKAKLGEAIKEHVLIVNQPIDPGRIQSRFLSELHYETNLLSEKYSHEKIKEVYKDVLGNANFYLYFGNN